MLMTTIIQLCLWPMTVYDQSRWRCCCCPFISNSVSDLHQMIGK